MPDRDDDKASARAAKAPIKLPLGAGYAALPFAGAFSTSEPLLGPTAVSVHECMSSVMMVSWAVCLVHNNVPCFMLGLCVMKCFLSGCASIWARDQ